MRTIAIVDDNPSMLQGLNRLLSAHGFRVQTFTSAELFLDTVGKCEADCLLLDIHLGGMSGIDLKRRLTSSGSPMPVIFMTAIDNEATRRQLADAGGGGRGQDGIARSRHGRDELDAELGHDWSPNT